jgi:hypothetical protein
MTGHEITITNTGPRPCALLGDEVVIVYRDSTGKTAVVPTESTGSVPAKRMLARGQKASAIVQHANDFAGYDPWGPECARPAVYGDLSLRFRDGGLLALKGLFFYVKCGDIGVSRWVVVKDGR